MNFEGLENLEKLGEFRELRELFSVFGTVGVLALFFLIIIAVAIVFLWVFSSIGIMNTAKKNNIPNPWFAFIPVARSYLIGKLGFEVYAKDDKKNPTLTWITLGLAAATIVLGDDGDGLNRLASIALLVFESMAFYNMFKVINPKNTTLYTVFTVLTDTLLGGIFLYVSKENKIETSFSLDESQKENDSPKDNNKNKEITKEKEIKKEEVRNNFCENCGFKLNKNTKFCPECGKKVK